MGMFWDIAADKKYRPISIRNLNQIVVGETYYVNDSRDQPTAYVIQELITNEEAYKRSGLKYKGRDKKKVNWFVASFGNISKSIQSLGDKGVTYAPYNPWMLFTDEQTAKDAYKEMGILYTPWI